MTAEKKTGSQEPLSKMRAGRENRPKIGHIKKNAQTWAKELPAEPSFLSKARFRSPKKAGRHCTDQQCAPDGRRNACRFFFRSGAHPPIRVRHFTAIMKKENGETRSLSTKNSFSPQYFIFIPWDCSGQAFPPRRPPAADTAASAWAGYRPSGLHSASP